MSEIKKVICMILILVFLPTYALARIKPIEKSVVSMKLRDEMWVKTNQVGLNISVEFVGNEEEVANKRAQISQSLRKLAQVSWHITRLERSQDSSGLARNRIYAEARIKATDLDKVSRSMANLSKPGTKFKLAHLDFEPSLEEIEAARLTLRNKLYDRVNRELAQLRKKFPKQQFEVNRVNFTDYAVRKKAKPLLAAMQEHVQGRSDAAMQASKKISAHAFVSLVHYRNTGAQH